MTDLFCHPYLPSNSHCFSNKHNDDDDKDEEFLSINFILLVIRKGRKLYNDVTLVYINYGVYRMITIPICCYLDHLRHAVIFP